MVTTLAAVLAAAPAWAGDGLAPGTTTYINPPAVILTPEQMRNAKPIMPTIDLPPSVSMWRRPTVRPVRRPPARRGRRDIR